MLLWRMPASGQEGSQIRSHTQLVPQCLPVLQVLLHLGGAFRAERSRWWEQKTCFIGVWIAEFTAMEAITQYFVCRVQRQQTSQGLGLFWLGLLVPLTWGSAGETAFMVNVCCWAEDWPLWPLCSEILPIPVLGPQDGQKSRASGHGWLKGVEERDLFVLGMGMFWETCTLEKWVLL